MSENDYHFDLYLADKGLLGMWMAQGIVVGDAPG